MTIVKNILAKLANIVDPAMGAALLGFKPNYANSAGRLLNLKLSEWISIADFGADATGATSAVAAINNAYSYAATVAASMVAAGTITGAAAHPVVVWPYGKYKVDGTITPSGYARTNGHRAVLQVSPGVDAWSLTGYQQQVIEGLVFVGGARAIKIATGNADSCTVRVTQCEFQQQTAAVFSSDGNSNSTVLSVENCKIQNSNASCVVGDFITMDRAYFDASTWIEVGSTTAFKCGTVGDTSTGCALELDSFMVPYSTLGDWVLLNETSSLKADRARFGGEPVSGATSLVKTYQVASNAVPTSLVVSNCDTFCAGPFIKFYGIPNVTIFRGNEGGTTPGNGFYFDASITSANLQLLAESKAVWDVEVNGCQQFAISGNATAAQYVWAITKEADAVGTVLVSDKVLQIPINSGGFGASNTSSNVAASASANAFGAPAFTVQPTAFASASWNQSFTTALAGLPVGLYTAVFDVENVTGEVLEAVTTCSALTNRFFLLKGRHVLNVSFYWDGSSSQAVGVQMVNWLSNAQQAKVSSIRLFAGRVSVATQNTVVYGAAPSTLQWEVGDRAISQAPAVGQSKASVCTLRGAPGTWVSEGNL